MKSIFSRPHVGREIAVLLTFKLAVILALFFAFFSPSHRIHPTAETTAEHLLGGGYR